MTIIEQIKAEIEKRQKENFEQKGQFAAGKTVEDADILSFLDTLESEKPMNQKGLEKEIDKRYLQTRVVGYQDGVGEILLGREAFGRIARHFAQWGAEHLADACKTSPNGLEEAAKEYAKTSFTRPYSGTPEEVITIIEPEKVAGFITGAKWDREKMMSEAVEGTMYEQPDGTTFLDCQVSFHEKMFNHEEKVKIIIVKED